MSLEIPWIAFPGETVERSVFMPPVMTFSFARVVGFSGGFWWDFLPQERPELESWPAPPQELAQGVGIARELAPQQLADRLLRRGDSPTGRSPLVLDLRSPRAFAQGHLHGSHRIVAPLLLSGEWPEGDLVLVDSGNGKAQWVADALHELGYSARIDILAGGFEAWRRAGLPVQPGSLPRSPSTLAALRIRLPWRR